MNAVRCISATRFCASRTHQMENVDQSLKRRLNFIHTQLRNCRACPSVCGSAVYGPALETRIMIIGQAPGIHEENLGRPFAYTAGKTLFKWLYRATGANEAEIRSFVYFSAVVRCFPGKAATGVGDRPPSLTEIENCRVHLQAEIQALKPRLILAVGRFAMAEILKDSGFTKSSRLNDFVGRKFTMSCHGLRATVVPLPHPSGVSRWPQTEPGKTKLAEALKLIREEMANFAP